MANFRIIGIKLIKPNPTNLSDRYKSIVKVLADSETGIFTFYDNYTITESDTDFIKKDCEREVPSDFFTSSPEKINIDICAIVGKNGSGKSTIIDFIMRLINNLACFAFSEYPSSPASERLHFVPDLYGALYYEINDEFFKLEQNGNKLTIYSQNGEKQYEGINYDGIIRGADLDARSFLNTHFFYTMVFNYSLYSYNFCDYIAEWDTLSDDDLNIIAEFEPKSKNENEANARKCWLTGLFHKNDGYQVPIVINPYREFGNIKTYNEKKLSKERLLYLVLIRDESKTPFFTNVIDDKEAHCINFNVPNYYYSRAGECKTALIRYLLPNVKSNEQIKFIFNEIIVGWSEFLGIDLFAIHKEHSNKLRRETINYLAYKTIKTLRNYNDYKYYYDKYNQEHGSADTYKMATELYNDRSHKTLKIRQALSQIIFELFQNGKKGGVRRTVSSLVIGAISSETLRIISEVIAPLS